MNHSPIPPKRRVGEHITYEHPQTHVQGSGTVTRLWPEYNAVVVLTSDGERVVHESNITDRKRRDFSGASTALLESASRGMLDNIRTLEGSGYDTTRLKDGLADIEAELADRAEQERQAEVGKDADQYIARPLHRFCFAHG